MQLVYTKRLSLDGRQKAMIAIVPKILRTGLGEVPVFEMGSGPHHVVLLHASSTGPMAFKGLAEHLAREERTIVMPAFAGYHGNAMDCRDPFETNCQIAVSVVNSREGDRCTLFGHSMGGLIATNAVARGANVDAFAVYEPIVVGALQQNNREDMDLLSWDQNIIAALHAEVAAGFSVSALPEGSRVAIIDDVVTTGATACALADAILLAGASEVHLWAATRAPHSA